MRYSLGLLATCALVMVEVMPLAAQDAPLKYEDLSGWWSYLDMDYANGCQDEDGQYRAALGRWERENGHLSFGQGAKMVGMYDGGCELSNERTVGGSLVLDASCEFEGETFNGEATFEAHTRDTLIMSIPGSSELRMQACEGTLDRPLPVSQVQPSVTEGNIEWTRSVSGGSEIEIPVFMTEGWVRGLMMQGKDYGTAFEPERFPVQLRQYRTDSTGRPFDYLDKLFGANADEVTYRHDNDDLGAISGYMNDRTEIFYGMCRKERVVVCFDMTWSKELQGTFGPIVERIAKGFRESL